MIIPLYFDIIATYFKIDAFIYVGGFLVTNFWLPESRLHDELLRRAKMPVGNRHDHWDFWKFERWARNYGFKEVWRKNLWPYIEKDPHDEVLIYAHRRKRLLLVARRVLDLYGEKLNYGMVYGTLDRGDLTSDEAKAHLMGVSHGDVSEQQIPFELRVNDIIHLQIQSVQQLRFIAWHDQSRKVLIPAWFETTPEEDQSRWNDFLENCPDWVRSFIVGPEQGFLQGDLEFFGEVRNDQYGYEGYAAAISYNPDEENGLWAVNLGYMLGGGFIPHDLTWKMHSPVEPLKMRRLVEWINQSLGGGFSFHKSDAAALSDKIGQAIYAHVGRVAVETKGQVLI